MLYRYSIKQAGELKASQYMYGEALPSLIYLTTSKVQTKQLNNLYR